MRRIADFTEEETIDFWAENLETFQGMYNNPEFKEAYKAIENPKETDAFRLLLKYNKPALIKMLKWVDPEPVRMDNFMPRVNELFTAMDSSFFTSSSTKEQTPST